MTNTATVDALKLDARIAVATARGAEIADKSVALWHHADVADVMIALGLQARVLADLMHQQSNRGVLHEWNKIMEMLADFPLKGD